MTSSGALYEQVFAKFKSTAQEKGLYPGTWTNADSFYLKHFRRWEDVVDFRKIILPQQDDATFDVAWVITPFARPSQIGKVKALVIGGDTQTGKVLILSGENPLSFVREQSEPHILAKCCPKQIRGSIRKDLTVRMIIDMFRIIWKKLLHA